jgi:hypothetical protein
MSMSFDALRVGKRYYLKNFGERFEFQIEEKKNDRNFVVKDLHTLEHYELQDLVKYGVGNDFELYELEK